MMRLAKGTVVLAFFGALGFACVGADPAEEQIDEAVQRSGGGGSCNVNECENLLNPHHTCCTLFEPCVDLWSDENNCGSCGHVCGTGQTCCSGVCTNEEGDASNCGACGNVCPGGDHCSEGLCCTPTHFNCDGNASNGCEVTVTNDLNNCGSCGHVCPTCPAGETRTCQTGFCNCI